MVINDRFVDRYKDKKVKNPIICATQEQRKVVSVQQYNYLMMALQDDIMLKQYLHRQEWGTLWSQIS